MGRADREEGGLVAQQTCSCDSVGLEGLGEGGIGGRKDGGGEAGV